MGLPEPFDGSLDFEPNFDSDIKINNMPCK